MIDRGKKFIANRLVAKEKKGRIMRRILWVFLVALFASCSKEPAASVQPASQPATAVVASAPSVTVEPVRKGNLLTGRVVKIADGDTLSIMTKDSQKPVKIRLYGIDAPETAKRGAPGQPYGQAAADFLKKLVAGQTVTVTVMGQDRYGRILGIVEVDGLNANVKLLAEGYAWAYREYLDRTLKNQFVTFETEAKVRKRGLWREPRPEYPSDYRKRMKGRVR